MDSLHPSLIINVSKEGKIPVNIEKIFGEELQKFRKEKGLSQEQLGFESGYHRTYISQLERGIKSPSLKTIFRISKALQTQPSKLIHQIELNAQ